MKNLFSITRFLFVILLLGTFSCQQNDNDVAPLKEEELEVYDDSNFVPTDNSNNTGRSAAEVGKFDGVRVWIYRNANATGTFKFRLVKTTPSNLPSDETFVGASASVDVSSINPAGTSLKWNTSRDLEVGQTYRVDIVTSLDAKCTEAELNDKAIMVAVANNNPYANGMFCAQRVGGDQITRFPVFDFKFISYKNVDGSSIGDQTQTTTNSKFVINVKGDVATEGRINGQEFVFGATN